MLSRGGKQSKRRTSWSMISQSSRRGRLRVLTKAGLTTKGTKTSITYSRLAHRWDTKLRSMKPPTRDWSSGHQSHWCKSSLFQTSGVLIQASPRGELLVRNRYSSWRGGSSDPPSTKTCEVWKVSHRERVEKFIRIILYRLARWGSYATVQSSNWLCCPKVTLKDTFRSQQPLLQINQSSAWKQLIVSSGQWKYDKQLHKQ